VTRRRLAAALALVLAPLAVSSAVLYVADDVWQAISMLISFALAVAAGWFGLVRRGILRVAGLLLAALLAAGVVESLFDSRVIDRVLIVGMFWIALAAAAAAFSIHVHLPRVARPRRPVLFVNPRSGDGKAVRLDVADAARARGITPIELAPGDDLAALVRAAVGDGADALAMAGGDGSQAVVAAIAAEHDLPYACIPSGTRNHFALDLGVDRDDVLGALDAFVDGGERRVDLAEVNGRVFVNNVSLGVYATALQRNGYRGAKLRTMLATLPEVAGPSGAPPDLDWAEPGGGTTRPPSAVVLVSNNRYRLGVLPGSGTRPRLDDGRLGIAVVEPRAEWRARGLLPRRLWRQWSARTLEIRSSRAVPAGIDGEATMLEAPLRFRILPSALRVRVASSHPGASPSAARPDSALEGVRALLSIAVGGRAHDPDRTGHPGEQPPALWRRAIVRPKPMRTDFPKWLVGDWTRAIRDPLDLLRLAPAIGALVTLIVGDHTHTGELIGCSLIVLAPRVLDVQRPFDLFFQIGINLAIWGNVFGLFDLIYGYDKVVHFMLPCGSAMLLYVALARLRIVPDLAEDAGLHDRAAMVLVTLAFGLTVGGLFEMWEWFSNTALGTHMFVSYGDSIGDLIDDALGALIGGVFLLWWTGRGWGTWRIPGAALRGVEPMPTAPPDRGGDLLSRFGDRIARLRPPRGHAGERPRPYPILPRWLVGDWGTLVRDPVDLIRLGLLAGALISAGGSDWGHAARFTVAFGLSALVRLAEAPRPFDAAFALGMGFQAWGAFSGAYADVAGYELVARVVASLSIAAALYLLLVRSRAVPDLSARTDIHERTGILLTATSLGFGVGMLYEIGAWASNGLFDARSFTFGELIAHMGISFAASAAGALLLVLWDRAGWRTRRVPAAMLLRGRAAA
jgi:diacylglycerol kinase family enzyme